VSSQYKVSWANVAESDLSNIVLYIAEESPTSALKILNKIREKASSLKQFPERGRIVPELRDQGINLYREIIVSPWRIVYRISGKEVYVLTVFDSRQNAEDVLLKKLTV